MLWRRRCTTGKTETCANHQPDLSGGERFHVPLIGSNQNEQVDETEETVLDSYHSGDEAGQSPYDQHGRGQLEMVFAAERLQSPGQEGKQRQEDGVGGGVPHTPMLNGMTLFTMSFILRSARSNTR